MIRIWVLLFIPLSLFGQSSFRMVQLARWDNDNLNVQGNQQYNEVYGYYDAVKHKEYALLCSIDSVYFIDVTNPLLPIICDAEAGKMAGCRNRDIVTYSHYAYSAAGQGNSSLQVFDLQYLPDSVHKVYDHDSLCIRSHTLSVDTFSARLYLCNTDRKGTGINQILSYAATVLSLNNPEVPQWLGDLSPPPLSFSFVHNAFAWRDTLYCSTGSSGLYIFNYQNVSNPVLIKALADYAEKGFNHSTAFDPVHRLLSFTDESSGSGVKMAAIKNVTNLTVTDIFRSSSQAVAHKPYFTYPFLWVAYYHDGVYAFDISNPNSVKVAAWFDTYSNNGDYSGLFGCWGIYPYLPSGNVLASDMANGLFILKVDTNTAVNEPSRQPTEVFPNPFTNNITVNTLNPSFVSITAISGQVVYQSAGKLADNNLLSLDFLLSGFYFLHIENENGNQTLKLIKR